MKKLIVSMFVITAVVLTGCSATSYPTSDNYPQQRVIVHDGYYPPGYYGPNYYGGGYYPPSRFRRAPYSRQRPIIIHRSAPPRKVIRVNPRNNNSNNYNWNKGGNDRKDNSRRSRGNVTSRSRGARN